MKKRKDWGEQEKRNSSITASPTPAAALSSNPRSIAFSIFLCETVSAFVDTVERLSGLSELIRKVSEPFRKGLLIK